MRRLVPLVLVICSVSCSHCEALSDSQLKGVVTGANGVGSDTVTGGGINLDANSGAYGHGGYQLWWSANANQNDVLSNAPGVTGATMDVSWSFAGTVEAKTYQSTDTGVCMGGKFAYLLNGAGWEYGVSAGGDSTCTAGSQIGAYGSFTVTVTDASAPHGTSSGTMAQYGPSCGPICGANCAACLSLNFTFDF